MDRGGGRAPDRPTKHRRSRERDKPTPLAVNDPWPSSLYCEHRSVSSSRRGRGYTSHGASYAWVRCAATPLANLGDPAREVQRSAEKGERGEFVLTALDPQRRGAELALPGIAHVSGIPRGDRGRRGSSRQTSASARVAQAPGSRAAKSLRRKSHRPRSDDHLGPPESQSARRASSKQPRRRSFRVRAPSLKPCQQEAPTKAHH